MEVELTIGRNEEHEVCYCTNELGTIANILMKAV